MSRIRASHSEFNDMHSPCSSSVLLTLPIACQICLGKVKEPTVCPNHHVFCYSCLNQWLKSCKMCPACRIPITDSQPCKRIIGSTDVDSTSEESSTIKSQLRRTRMEVLVQEYEDDFNRMDVELDKAVSESTQLKKQNDTLRRSLENCEEKIVQMINETRSSDLSNANRQVPNDLNTVLLLSSKLQCMVQKNEHLEDEMQHVQQELKAGQMERTRLTQEIGFLRDEAVQSPKKHNRYTVMALQTKLDNSERELQKLRRALQRSDDYSDFLQSQITELRSCRNDQQHHGNEALQVTSSNGLGRRSSSPRAAFSVDPTIDYRQEPEPELVVKSLPRFCVNANGDLAVGNSSPDRPPASSAKALQAMPLPQQPVASSNGRSSHASSPASSPYQAGGSALSPERQVAPISLNTDDDASNAIEPYSNPTLYPACAKLIQLTRAHQSGRQLAQKGENASDSDTASPPDGGPPPLLNKPTGSSPVTATAPSESEAASPRSLSLSSCSSASSTCAPATKSSPSSCQNAKDKRVSTDRVDIITPPALKKVKSEPHS